MPTMLTEVIRSKKEGRKAPNRSRMLWLGTLGIGFVAALLVAGVRAGLAGAELNPLLNAQGAVYDQGMTSFARRALEKGIHGPVTVIAIKESTNKDLEVPSFVPGIPGKLSFQNADHKRAFHARLLQNLTKLGAKTVVFDVVFDREFKNIDGYFAQSIKENGNVILAALLDKNVESGGESTTIVMPNPILRAAAKGVAVVNFDLERDRAVRKFTWWYPGIDEDTAEDVLYPALGPAAAAAFEGKNPKTIIKDEVEAGKTFLGKPIISEPSGKAIASRMRFYGELGRPAGEGSVINYENIVRRGQDEAAMARLREQIQGKIVIVGDVALLSQDTHRVPVISRTQTFGSFQQLPGVELQAHVTQAALRGEYVREAPDSIVWLLIFVTSMLVAIIARFLPPGPAAVGTLLVIGGLFWLSIEMNASSGYFLEPVHASVGAVAALIMESGFMYVGERKQRERVKRQLSRHVGAGVADKLADDEWPEFQGESREITMLFSDLQGFTTLSETMTPAEICALLNRYFGVIFPILDRQEGTLDKLMGDGMMAYFGFPRRQPDHAARAIRCAIEVQEALESWQRQPENAGLPPLRTRIGIHTGVATVGEVGAGNRAEFSVMGDVVNVASRLEGMNKDFGTNILISENTRDSAGEIVPMTYRGVATVRGRKEPTPVYSIDQALESGRQRTSRSASMRVPTTEQQSSQQP